MRRAVRPLLALALAALAATPPVAANASSPAPITPGPRLESTVVHVALERFDGSSPAPRATAAIWRQIVHQAGRVPGALEDALDLSRVRARAAALEEQGIVALGVIDVEIERASRSADGRTRAPRLFAFAALSEKTFRGREAVFRLDRSTHVTGAPGGLDLEIDLDDGRGYRPIAVDEPIRVRYERTGEKTLRLRARTADGRLLHAAARFHVWALSTPDPHDTLFVTASEAHQGANASGRAYVYRAAGHDSLVNPVIVIEGFDLENDMDWDELYALLNQQDLVERIRAEGFDLVLLDFDDATEPLQRNGFLVAELVQQVAAAVPETDAVIVGASMGGLLGRFALAWLEDRGVAHGVRTFLSYDAPHRGANIPLGIQYWLDFFQEESSDAAFLLSRLDRPASRQMLVYHHTDPPGATGEADPLRGDFLAELAALGSHPAAPRLAAIANGSGAGVGQGFAPGEQILRYEHDGSFVDVRGSVWAVPDGSTTMIFDGLFEVFGSGETMQVTVSGTRPYDDAPGGWRASMTQMDTTEAPVGDIEALHPAHCFIPTVSALDLDVPSLSHDVLGDPGALSRTPFDAIYVPDENQEHVAIDSTSAEWILAEIRGPVVAVKQGPEGATLELRAPVPNPARGETRIRFRLAEAGPVHVAIYDLRGRLVRTLFEGAAAAGVHAILWDGRLDDGGGARPGVYFGRVTADGASAVARLVWLR